jgi:hypothetical protein
LHGSTFSFGRAGTYTPSRGFGNPNNPACEIARGYSGSLDVISVQEETRLTFNMPLA